MEDNNKETGIKQKLADQELSNIFGAGLVALKPEPSPSDFTNLPQVDPVNDAQNSTTVNNLNVNVNISGKSTNTNTSEKEIRTIVQNAIPTVADNSVDLKKNLPEISNISLNQNLNNIHMDLETNNQEYNISFDDGMSPYITNPDIIVDIPDVNEISSYSHSSIDGDRIHNQHTQQILNNIVSYSMGDQNILNLSPYSSIDSSVQNNVKNEFNIDNLQVQPEYNNSMEQVSTLFQERKRLELEDHYQEKNKKLQQEALFDSQKSSERDLYDANTVGVSQGLNKPMPLDNTPKSFKHLNPVSSTIPSFMEKMNSPPIWRTVLG